MRTIKRERVGLGRPARAVAVLAVPLATALVLSACGSDDTTGITTAQVSVGEVSEVVEAPATITARSTVTVTSPSTGTIDSLEVADGDTVRRGDRLLVIDSPQAQRQLSEARKAQSQAQQAAQISLPRADVSAALEQADATAEAAFAAAEDAIALLPEGEARDAAEVQLQQQRAQYAATRAGAVGAASDANRTVAALETALEGALSAQTTQLDLAVAAAERAVEALVVTAPISGIVTLGAEGGGGGGDPADLLAQVPSSLQGAASSLLGGGGGGASSQGSLVEGNPVSSGQTVATLTDTSTLGLSAQVDETDVLLVSEGIRADVQLDALPDAVYGARVTSVGVTPTTSSRGGVSYIVRLALGEGEDIDGKAAPKPRPGMSAVTSLKVRTSTDDVAVPASAVFRDQGRDQVWVVVEGIAERRTVRLGAEGSDVIAVVSGLEVGETIVISGADRVREGQEIP